MERKFARLACDCLSDDVLQVGDDVLSSRLMQLEEMEEGSL